MEKQHRNYFYKISTRHIELMPTRDRRTVIRFGQNHRITDLNQDFESIRLDSTFWGFGSRFEHFFNRFDIDSILDKAKYLSRGL